MLKELLKYLVIAAVFAGYAIPKASAKSGVLDLRTHDWNGSKLINIGTGWIYYDKQLLEPSTIAQGTDPQDHNIQVTNQFLAKYGVEGFGTSYLKVILDKPRKVGFWAGELLSSSKIFIDGQSVGQVGVVATTEENEQPALSQYLVVFTPKSHEFEIIVQHANFITQRRLTNKEVLLGEPNSILDKRRSYVITDAFVVGAITIMGFYHFALYFLRREERAPLWFGFFSLLISIRTVLTSMGYLIYHLWEGIPISLSYKVEYLTFSIGVLAFIRFFNLLYNQEIPRWLLRFGIYASLGYSVLIAFGTIQFFTSLLNAFQVIVLGLQIAVIVALVNVVRRKEDGSFIFLTGFVILAVCVIHDMLISKDASLLGASIAHFGMLGFILCQAIILSKRFAADYRLLKVAEGEIRQLNQGLEEKVELRTKTIRTIYDSVKSGFLLVDKDGRVKGGFTKSCHNLFHKEISEGQRLSAILEMNSRQEDHFQLGVDQVFDDILPEDVTLKQIARRFLMKDGAVNVEGSAIRNKVGKVDSIMFTISDAGPMIKAENEVNLNRSLLKISREKESFKSFVKDVHNKINQASECLQEGDASHLKMILHTLKGNFFAFGLDEIADYIHLLEDYLSPSQDQVIQIKTMLDKFISTHSEVIHLAQENDSYKLSKQKVNVLRKSLLAENAGEKVISILDHWVEDMQKVSIESLLSKFGQIVENLAKQLGKEIDYRVEGGETLVDPSKVENIIHNMIHLIRNAVDHGIEFPDERGSKKPTGSITVRVESVNDLLKIHLIDDGAGINANVLKEKAISEKLITKEEAFSLAEQDTLRLVFSNGLSTKNEVTGISGRGVGMGALLAAVQEAGGNIEVVSHLGRGTKFTIVIDMNFESVSESKLKGVL